MKTVTFGERFGELDMSNKYDIKHIASLVRGEIALARKAGLIDKGFRTSVQVGGGTLTSSINIKINALPEGLELYTDAYKRGEYKHRRFTDEDRYCVEYLKLRELLDGILNLWNYDNSDTMSDYFDRNYYGEVGVKWQLRAEYDKKANEYYDEWVKL
jgi:hypothetical protein